MHAFKSSASSALTLAIVIAIAIVGIFVLSFNNDAYLKDTYLQKTASSSVEYRVSSIYLPTNTFIETAGSVQKVEEMDMGIVFAKGNDASSLIPVLVAPYREIPAGSLVEINLITYRGYTGIPVHLFVVRN